LPNDRPHPLDEIAPAGDVRAPVYNGLRERPFPKQLGIEVTAYCNLRCAMCHNATLQRPKGSMPLALFRRCADEVAAVSPSTEVWFSFNGEPLLEPERLFEMVAYAKSVGLTSLNLNSNATQLNDALTMRLLVSGLDLVVFGIDGLLGETYNRIRRGGDRDRVYTSVERFLKLRRERHTGPVVMVQFIEMPENAHERDAFVDYWLARGAIVKVRRQLSWGGRIHTALTVPSELRTACAWAVNLMHVCWDGTVPRCCGDTDGTEAVGNAWVASLSSLWRQMKPYRAAHLSGQFDLLPQRCAACHDWMVGMADHIRPALGADAPTRSADLPATVCTDDE
jgi:uncharacterized Fe-S cluster-containing radical SAM superfamily protein